MARAGPKSRKQKPGPKSKKAVIEEEVEPIKNDESSEDLEPEEDKADAQSENEKEASADSEEDGKNDEENEEEPPVKKSRGRPSKKGGAKSRKAPAKASPKSRKTPSRAKKESDDEEDEKEYEVDYIMDSKTVKGKKQYLIKWKGYKVTQASWEPEDNLNCDDAIQKYEEELKKPARSLREERKETERYVDVAGTGDHARRRHSRRNDSSKTPRKSYREVPDSD